MSKSKLKEYICDTTRITQGEAGILVDVFIAALTDRLLSDGYLTLPNFGRFDIKRSRARVARNPRTGDPVQLNDRNVIRFKPASKLKELIK